MIATWELAVSRACSIVGLSRRAWYRPDPGERQAQSDAPVIDALNTVVQRHCRWGFWKCFHSLRQSGHSWNHKRVWRVYTQMKLNQKRRSKKRLPSRTPVSLSVPALPNHTWSFDFMSDSLYSGQRYRVLNIIDEGVREALDIVADTSITATRIVRVLDQLKDNRGLPKVIRVDNGPEMTSQKFMDWCADHSIQIAYIQPGKPTQNAYIERFNRSFRTEVLDPHIFTSLSQIRELSWAWLVSYNEERPHASLGNIPPAEFKRRLLSENSSLELCA